MIFYARRGLFLGLLLALSAASGVAQRTVFRSVDAPIAIPTHVPTPPIDIGHIADLVHSLVNDERRQRGLEPLTREKGLDRIGKHHSEDMAVNGYFDHVDLQGRDATQRARAGRYVCIASMDNPTPVSIGENLFAGFRYSSYSMTYYPGKVVSDFTWMTEEELAREAVEAWMHSPPHRKNLLHPDYHSHGIGIYVAPSLEVFVTQNLC